MRIKLINKLNKGDVLPITVENDRLMLNSLKSGNKLDITELVEDNDKKNIFHIGRALAVVRDNESIEVSYCFNYHTHSQYSILDGMSPLKEIAKKSSGITAICDHGNMFTVLKWQKAMENEGKKPVFGFEAYVEDVLTGEKNGSHGIFLVKNEEGLKNAFELTSRAYDNFYRKPHVSLDMIKTYSKGLIFTSACVVGELAKVIEKDYEGAKNVALFYKNIFGEDFYIEIQRHNFELEKTVNPLLIKLANELGVKVVGANDSHFINESDKAEHKILLSISYGKNIDEVQDFEGDGYWYKTDAEMVSDFWDYPEAIANTLEIASKCNCLVETGVYHMPYFEIPKEFKDDNEYLSFLIDKGFKERFYGTPKYSDETYISRIEYEKSVIMKMGFASYFLIVWDYVNWAKNQGILVGPGRGSGAGSLCLYCLKITDIDPIKYSLKFERFLNPDRVSMPDIDMDFEYARRSEVIEYVRAKYGNESVCNIITFGTMQAKNAIRDVTRVKGKSVSFGGDICKKINPKAKDLKGSLEGDEASLELVEAYNSDEEVKEVINSALKLEGNPRQTGVHACGIIVADAPVRNYLPTAMVKNSKSTDKDAKSLVSQVTMEEVEEMGILKFDFLGLRTMSVIGNCIKSINKARSFYGHKTIDNYLDIPLTDPYVYADISKGQSYAVFQIESEGMRGFMKELFADVKGKIAVIEEKYGIKGYGEFATAYNEEYMQEMTAFGEELFERMIAGVSLYRPGPMDYIPDYIKNMNNPEDIVYDTPETEPVLKPTYGIIVYQEQVMDLVRVLAGFSAGDSDKVRKGMSKKKAEIIDEYGEYFIHGCEKKGINGCVKNGIPENIAVDIWNKMVDFAKYAFNKSHAGTYSVLTVVCAWLKFYYPAPYMSATLNAYIDNKDKLKNYINNAKSMGINILPPDINKSGENFLTNGKDILFGLKGLKGTSKVIAPIIEERDINGPFKSVCDFVVRTYPKKATKRAFVAFVHSGALDCFGYSRKALIEASEELMNLGKKAKKKLNNLSFLNMINEELTCEIENIPEYDEREKLNYELETTNLYISSHPLDKYKDILYDIGASEIASIYEETEEEENKVIEGRYTFAGTISNVREFLTKKGEKMASFTLSDRGSEIKCTVFSREYECAKAYLDNKNSLVVVKGEVKDDVNYGVQIIVNSIIEIDYIPKTSAVKEIHISLNSFDNLAQYELKSIMRVNQGDIPLLIHTPDRIYRSTDNVCATSGLFMALSNKYGYDKVEFR